MVLEVDIRQDEALRDEIREMIEGQVRKVTRAEILKIAKKQMEDLGEETIKKALEIGIERYVRTMSGHTFRETFSAALDRWIERKLPEHIRKELPDAIDKAVDNVINRLVKYRGRDESDNGAVARAQGRQRHSK